MKKVVLGISLIGLLMFNGCQSITRELGGTTRITLDEGEKFINITWKENNLWVLVEKENTYIFKEYSNMGILQGKVIINEK